MHDVRFATLIFFIFEATVFAYAQLEFCFPDERDDEYENF